MHEKIKTLVGFGLGLFLIFASWATIQATFFLQSSRSAVENLSQDLKPVIKDLQAASKEVAGAAQDLAITAREQRETFTSDQAKRGIGLLLRTGDDLNRTVKKLNVALDKINDQTIPKVNQTLDSTEQTIATTRKVIIRLSDQSELILSDTDKTINQLFQLLSDPNIQRAIAGVAEAAQASGKTAHTVEATSEEIKAAIPEMVNSFKGVASNADLSSQEVLTFLTGLNKPLTRKQKLVRFVLEAILKSSPALLRR